MAGTRYVIAENLKRMLVDKKLGANRCADGAGVSRSQFYEVLAARTTPTIDWLERVAHELETEVWKLAQPYKRKAR